MHANAILLTTAHASMFTAIYARKLLAFKVACVLEERVGVPRWQKEGPRDHTLSLIWLSAEDVHERRLVVLCTNRHFILDVTQSVYRDSRAFCDGDAASRIHGAGVKL